MEGQFTGRQTRWGDPRKVGAMSVPMCTRAPSARLGPGRQKATRSRYPRGNGGGALIGPLHGDQPKPTHHLGKEAAPGLQQPGQGCVPAPAFTSWSPGGESTSLPQPPLPPPGTQIATNTADTPDVP